MSLQQGLRYYRHRSGKDVALYSAPPNGSRATKHPTWRRKIREAFQWGSGGWSQKPTHHQEYCSNICGGCVQCLVSYIIFVVDLVACRLIFS